MTDFISCAPISETVCPPSFALRVSGWINIDNIGDSTPGLTTLPPAGMRMRWNCPFLAPEPTGRIGYPARFRVLRTKDLSATDIVRRTPTAGHQPRTVAPSKLWHAVQFTDLGAYAGPNQCDQADAVYFELDVRAGRVEAVLVDVTGRRSIAIDLHPGDRFYYEMPNLHAVLFSAPPFLLGPVEFLDLRGASGLDLSFKVIGTVDARAWVGATLAAASERFANPVGEAYVSLTSSDWDALAQRGAHVIQQHDAGGPSKPEDVDVLFAAAAARWDAATLMGWGFLDGEHPAHLTLDKIDTASMMTAGTKGLYGYQVVAEFDLSDGRAPHMVRSSMQFVSSAPEGVLTPAAVRALSSPRATVHVRNAIVPGPTPDHPDVVSKPEEQVFCRSSYFLATSNIANERIRITPMASASVLSGDVFETVGTFEQGAGDPIVRVVGLERRITRSFDYKVPFVDATVWLDITIGDGWDRHVHQGATGPKSMVFDYDGAAPPLAKAICDSQNCAVELTLDPSPPWIADVVARLAGGQVETMARNPSTTRVEIKVNAGPPFLRTGQTWGATIDPAPNAVDREKLVGGVFSADTFNALIMGFSTTPSGQLVCEFQANAHCAGEAIYPTVGGMQTAFLREAETARRLWGPLGKITLDARGVPTTTTQSTSIADVAYPNRLTTSATLWFATRMTVSVSGHTVYGPISTPVAAPYLHPAPPRPAFCLRVQQLGTDYYERALVKISPEDCDRFSSGLAIAAVGAAGNDATAADMSQTRGVFQPQLAFQDKVVFEAFDALARTPDGDPFTVGVAYVRPSDDASSPPLLQTITARATGD